MPYIKLVSNSKICESNVIIYSRIPDFLEYSYIPVNKQQP